MRILKVYGRFISGYRYHQIRLLFEGHSLDKTWYPFYMHRIYYEFSLSSIFVQVIDFLFTSPVFKSMPYW